MLHIILLIFKIIGMIVLVLLGLFLLILFTVLLVPIRYRVAVSHGKELRMEGRASWLLHLIHAGFSHIEDVLHIRIRVFWFILYDNLRPKSPKIKKKKNTAKRKVQRASNTKTLKIKTSKTKAANTHKKSENIIKDLKSDTIRSAETYNQSETIRSVETDNQSDKIRIVKTDNQSETIRIVETHNKSDTIRIVDTQNQLNESLLDTCNEELPETLLVDKLIHENEHQDAKEEKKSLLQKILLKFKGMKDKIKAFFHGFKKKINSWFETAVNIKQKAGLILAFIKDELNREGFHVTYHSLKKLLKHILPTKLNSKIIFGTGDPCTTGQVLGIMSILYSFYGDKIQITPDFENTRFEGKHDAKGRIRLITILIIVIKLMLDKKFKQLKRNFLILKEEL